MPIANDLLDVALQFECPACKHPIIRNGSWFKSISRFTCDGCGAGLRLGYFDKLALFDRHKHLVHSRWRSAGSIE